MNYYSATGEHIATRYDSTHNGAPSYAVLVDGEQVGTLTRWSRNVWEYVGRDGAPTITAPSAYDALPDELTTR